MSTLNLAAVSVRDAAKALQTTEPKILAHIAQGAPVVSEGVINLLHYGAWLNSQLHRAARRKGR